VFGGGSSLQLFRIAGIRVGVHPSWFLILFLWIYWLQDSFANVLGSDSKGFTAAVIAAFLFFGSIVLHELGHAFAAKREGIGVAGIDLFFFGGFMKATRASQTPGEEFRVSAAGPFVTFLIAVVFAAFSLLLEGGNSFWDAARLRGGSSSQMLDVLVSFTVSMNVILLVFNLIPAFPLDGGRIARSAVWQLTGNRHKATRFSALLGQLFALILVGYGVYTGVNDSNWSSGLWYVVLGWILGSAARQELAASTFSTLSDRLDGVTANDIMDADPLTIPASMTVADANEGFFVRNPGWPWFAVVEDDGRFAGLAHRAAVEHAAQSGTAGLPVRSVVAVGEEVRTDTPLEALVGSEALRRLGALMAVDGEGHLRGVVTLEQVSRALQARLAAS
jgi:Zn-dependent protease/CBS domain-containing protein